MGLPSTGSIVLVRFPFSDLSQTKLRPAVVLANAGFGDSVLCQVTSNAFSDLQAVKIGADDLQTGTLRTTSYARPSKLFTANSSLIASTIGQLGLDKFDEILNSVIALLLASKQP